MNDDEIEIEDPKLDDEREAIKLKRANELSDVRELLGMRSGRNFLWRQLERLGVFRTPYVAGDPGATAFNCGSHNFGLWLFAEIMETSPEFYLLMQKENCNV